MDVKKLENFLKDHKQPKFRLEQIRKAIFQDGISSFLEISNIPKDLRELLDKEIKILSFDVEKVFISSDERSMKAALTLSDGNYIETVLISPKNDTWTVCVSSQVGCPLNCAFCLTGQEGFKRDLTSEEITDQILFWKQYLKKEFKPCPNPLLNKPHPNPLLSKEREKVDSISNVVYMGMGEPFLNWDQVSESLKILTDEKLFGFGSRSLSVSTSGITEGIEKMVQKFPQVNLAISLHFADDEKRNLYMPVNKKYNLESLKNSLQKYFQKSKRKVFIEYILFDGLNDTQEDAKRLIKYLNSVGHIHLLHVNLIPYNSADQSDKLFKTSFKNNIIKFKIFLERNHINVTTRKSLGSEIQGACGQLAAH